MRLWKSCCLTASMLAVLLAGCMSRTPNTPPPSSIGQREPGPTDPDAPAEFQVTASGLKYRILRTADGAQPDPGDTVLCHYRGWLDSGREFDSTYKRGEPATFSLSGVIAGWTEGLQFVSEGGMIELEVPPELGYGEQGVPGAIPPNATLHFIVELIRIQ